jgi:hypothetical protein
MGTMDSATQWSGVSGLEVARFSGWCLTSLLVTVASTAVLVREAVRLPVHATLTAQYVVTWMSVWLGLLLLLSVVAGVVVFRRTTPWRVVLTWPWLVGPAVGFGFFIAVAPYADGPNRLCPQVGGSCDTAWGMGAMFLSVLAACVVGGVFIAAATVWRWIGRSTTPPAAQ